MITPRTSPIAQPVRQCTVALKASRLSDPSAGACEAMPRAYPWVVSPHTFVHRHARFTGSVSLVIVSEREPVADFLDEKRKEIQSRLKELRPLVDEFHRLEAAERSLSGVEGRQPGATGSTTTRRRRSTRPSSNGRRGRPRGSGTRATQAL